MLKRYFGFILIILCMTVASAFSVGAQCLHDFTPEADESNMVTNKGFSHSYSCRKNCGAVGTVADGADGREECGLILVSEKKATCVSEGKRIYFCSVCCRSREAITQRTSHSYIRTRRLPTCTAQGYDLYTCSVCGDSYKENITQKLSHISDGGVINSQPTYSKKGSLKLSCRVCGCTLGSKSLPKLIPVSKAPVRVSGFKVKSCGTATVNLIWKRSEGAASYKILYTTDKKKWKTVTTEKNSLSLKKLKSAQKYYFKIYAVGKGGQSAVSEIITACTKPEKAEIKKASSAKKGTVKLEWKKLSRVSGYELSYTADSFSEKKTVKSVAVGKADSKTVKNLKSGKRYKFRIRAYKKFGSKRVYGAYSKVKSVKIK